MKVWPHIGASLAAGFTDELRFEIGEPDVIRPWISADREAGVKPLGLGKSIAYRTSCVR
jgi:hypothetical protein